MKWLWIKTRVVAGLPLLQTFVAGPLLQTLVADLCVEYCSLQGACRGGFVAEHPRLLQTFVAKWLPKPATRPMFLIRCQIYSKILKPGSSRPVLHFLLVFVVIPRGLLSGLGVRELR